MQFEDYLIEQKSQIIAINSICRIINNIYNENYHKFNDKFCIDELIALNTSIQIIAYCMRLRRKEVYKSIDDNYTDDFNYDKIIYENN